MGNKSILFEKEPLRWRRVLRIAHESLRTFVELSSPLVIGSLVISTYTVAGVKETVVLVTGFVGVALLSVRLAKGL